MTAGTRSAVDGAAEAATPPSRPVGMSLRARVSRDKWMYVFLIPGALYFLLFHYIPLLGNIAAFQDYSPFFGFRGSQWVGLQNFENIFTDPEVITALRNTVIISLLQIIFAFPAPIALALLLNSMMSSRVKRIVQSIVYLPHFIGWVIVIAVWDAVLGGTGLVQQIFTSLDWGTVNIVNNPSVFKELVTAQVIWKEVGWGTIIFLAAITNIDSQLYESAAIDGAGSWRRTWHVTLPGMSTVIALLLILRVGSVLSVGFEQIFLQQDKVGINAAEVVDTFVYFRGIAGGDWGLATAAGLLKGIVATVLVLGANKFTKRLGGEGIF